MGRYSKVVKNRKKNRPSFLPDHVQAFIARRLIDGLALAFFLAGLFVMLAIATYDQMDPSWNTASSADAAQISNILGAGGAHLADLLLQTIGMGGVIAGIILAIWGVRIVKRQFLSPFPARLAAALAAIIAASIAFARLPAHGWLPQPYLGGSGGALLLDRIAAALHPVVPSHEHMIVAVFAGFVLATLMVYAAAVTRAEMRYVALKIYGGLRFAALIMAHGVMSFYDWLRYYGDPAYAPPRREKPVRAPRQKAPVMPSVADTGTSAMSPPVSSSPPSPAPSSSAAAKTASSIRVVSPHKIQEDDAGAKNQTSFTLTGTGDWQLPATSLLQDVPESALQAQLDEDGLRRNAEMLQNVLADFNVSGDIVSIHPGPVVTLYELEPAPGTKTSRVIGLADDIARSMAAVSVRCAVVPGRNVIGIELPNAKRQTVYLRELLETRDMQKTKAHLPLVLGKDIGGKPIIADLAKMPHLLIAGTTGSGKSVAVNTMILSLVYALPPEKCRLIMIDPKMLELSSYDDIPHLLSPVVTEPGKAVVSLKWAVQEMENRYRAMSKLGVRNIEGYNARLAEALKKGETLMRKVQTGFDPDTGKPVFEEQPMDMTELPYIVVIVDEFADLMLVAGKDVEGAIQRLAQMARAAGIHLIMATQRPSTDVITGVIKANFPTRISFQVTSIYDSRTILGEIGAEQLLGMGDMLYMSSGGRIQRVHGPFVSDDEVTNVVDFLKEQGEPQYLSDVTEGGFGGDSEVMAAMFGDEQEGGTDDLYDQAVALVARERKASTSFIQRHLKIGYNRAATIIDEMEKQGVIGPANHVGKRDVLVGDYSDA